MKLKHLLIVAVAALPTTLASAAQYNKIGGTVCEVFGAHTPNVNVYSAYGLMNVSSTSDMRPVCEVPFQPDSINPTTVNPSQGRVDFLDLNSTANASHTGSVRCNMNLSIVGGTVVSMGTRYSCATAGGCTSGNNNYTGVGYLLFPDTVAATANVIATNFDCVLPVYESPNWAGPSIIAVAVSTSTP